MDTSQNFNVLEVDTLKTNKLDYSYSNNILDITLNNCKTLKLNNSHSDYILNTTDYNMDIDIELTSQKIGTKHRILITNKQNSLLIHCKYDNDKFKGSCKINNNSNTINNEILKNNLTKKIINITDEILKNNDIIFIPTASLGLNNGGYIDLVYIGNNNCNIPITNQVGYWLISGNLIGDIKIPKSIVGNSSIKMILTLYLLNKGNKKKIICGTTKHPTTNEIYFNKIENNNISLFLNLSYIIQLFDIETSLIVYNSETYDSSDTNNLYNIKINKNLYLNPSVDGFISLKDIDTNNTNNTKNTLSFLNDFDRTVGIGTADALDFNIQPLYNKTITDYKKLNVIQYKIEKSTIEIISGFFNIIDIQAYNNSTENTITLPSSIIGKYNIFTDVENKIGVGTIYNMY
tara:strand:- start:15252 stop:16463 length:1212 start_codon:yes stop_codon:yes gene_type:complete